MSDRKPAPNKNIIYSTYEERSDAAQRFEQVMGAILTVRKGLLEKRAKRHKQ